MRSETWLLRWLRPPGAGKELIRSREAFSCPQSLHGDKAVAPTLQPDCLRSPRDDWKPTCTGAFRQWRISGGMTARKVPGWVQSGACVRSEVGPPLTRKVGVWLEPPEQRPFASRETG